MELLLKLLGIFFGVSARTFIPYLRKLSRNKIKNFIKVYWGQAFTSLVFGTIITLLIFPQFNISSPGTGLEASIKLFCLAFGFGFGCNSIVSEAAKWTEKKGRSNI